MRRPSPALLVVLGGVTAALHVGKLPTAIPVLRDALDISLVEAGFLLSLLQWAGMVLGLAVGLAADGVGLKRTMVAGLALLSAASILGGMASTTGELMVLRALEGVGFLLAAMPAPSLIRRLVDGGKVSAALGLWGAYMPLGTAIALLLGPPMMALQGWRGWWFTLGALSGAMCVWLWLALPADKSRGAATESQASWQSRLARTLSARGPWLVALAFAAYSAQWLSVVGFLPSLYANVGWNPAWAGAATALVALVNMGGNIASGRLLQAGVAAQRLLYIGFGAMAAGGFCAFAIAGTGPSGAVATWLSLLGAIVFSMFGGLIPGTLFALAVRLAPGDNTVSTTVGWMQQWSALGQFAGPPVVALVASVAGGFQWSGAVTAACACCGLCVAVAIGRLTSPPRP